MLARLRHRAVSGGHDQDRAVHLRGTRDHVLDVVGMARAVDVGVVTTLGLVLDVRGVDRDAALALLGSVVDRGEVAGDTAALLREDLRDRSRQRRLAMVDVTNGADIEVGLGALELLLGHRLLRVSRTVVLKGVGSGLRGCGTGRLGLRRDGLGDVLGHFLVAEELHGVRRATLRKGADVGRVAEHLG